MVQYIKFKLLIQIASILEIREALNPMWEMD